MVSPVATTLHAVTRCTNTLVAVGAAGKIVRSTDNGITWDLDQVPAITLRLRSVSAWLDVVVAVDDGGNIWRSADAGVTWAKVGEAKTALRAVTSSPSGRWAACGNDGTIMLSLDNGLTWTIQEPTTTADLYGACAYLPGGQIVMVGSGGIIVLE
jgi:photosystem II stability/assembly factor-like uncharacterized protein